jgi:hypothetical protein
MKLPQVVLCSGLVALAACGGAGGARPATSPQQPVIVEPEDLPPPRTTPRLTPRPTPRPTPRATRTPEAVTSIGSRTFVRGVLEQALGITFEASELRDGRPRLMAPYADERGFTLDLIGSRENADDLEELSLLVQLSLLTNDPVVNAIAATRVVMNVLAPALATGCSTR